MRHLQLLMLLGLLAAAQGARAQAAETPAPAATPDAVRAPPRPPGVRASHRVDVIAPGERVETVLDRMRTGRGTTPPSGTTRPAERPPVRPPDKGGARPEGPRGPDHQPPRGSPPPAAHPQR